MIERRTRRGRDGKAYSVYRIRWRDDDGRERSRTLPRGTRKDEAEAFERRVITLKRGGELAVLDAGRETLAEFAEHWWRVYAEPNLEDSTLDRYAQVWNVHVLVRLGDLRLRELKPAVLAGFRADLELNGVGAPTIRKAFVVIQSMLARAVEEGRIASNPAALVRKPPQRREREVVVVPPIQVERLRRHVAAADRYGRGHRDAMLIAFLAYVGTRPWSEGAELTWGQLQRRTVVVRDTKRKRTRSVDVLEPVRHDLARYRIAMGGTADDQLIFAGSNGEAWSDSDVRNWRRRIWKPALKAVNAQEREDAEKQRRRPQLIDEDMVPYDLRHCFVSLLLHEGRLSLGEIAEQAGHSVAVLSSTYAHVIAELRGGERVSAAEQIEQARAELDARDQARRGSEPGHLPPPEIDLVRPIRGPQPVRAARHTRPDRSTEPSRRGDSNPRPPLYESGALAN